MNRAADNIRILSAAMVEKARSGHPGGPMGGADFINVLYTEFLRYDPDNPFWEGRDRFFLDAGHMSPMLYATLALCGKFTMDDLGEFRQWGSLTPGHPELDLFRGIENSSGPLGLGHAFAAGAAIAAKFLPSEGLFRRQSQAYQESVLPRGVMKFGLTAGLPVTLEGMIGTDGEIWGMKSFGFSAPTRY